MWYSSTRSRLWPPKDNANLSVTKLKCGDIRRQLTFHFGSFMKAYGSSRTGLLEWAYSSSELSSSESSFESSEG